jgi:hypothetical protein
MAMVIAWDSDCGTMEWKYTAIVMILLIGVIGTTGCTGTSSAPAATPTLSSVAFPGTNAPAPAPVPSAAWTTETPYAGHPYTKTYSFHGSGDYEDFTFSTDSDATWNFRMDPGSGYFLVSLKDVRNNEITVLADGTNAGSTQKSVTLKAGNYHFDIAADAPWYITMTTP